MADNKSPLKLLSSEIIGLLAIFVIILGGLNYFNILSLSQLYPNQFSSLPHQTPKITLACPVDKNFCSSGREILERSTFLGLGYDIKYSNIYAVISGKVDFSSVNDKQNLNHARIILTGLGKDEGYVATYDYSGLTLIGRLKSPIKSGDKITEFYGSGYLQKNQRHGINLIIKVKTKDNKEIHSKFK